MICQKRTYLHLFCSTKISTFSGWEGKVSLTNFTLSIPPLQPWMRNNIYFFKNYSFTNESFLSVGVSEGCTAEPVCTPNPCIASEWCRDIWRKFVCLPRLCASRPCKNGGTCVEGVDREGKSKFRCQCPRSFEGALCEVQSSVVIATEPGIGLENGLIIGRYYNAVSVTFDCLSTIYWHLF